MPTISLLVFLAGAMLSLLHHFSAEIPIWFGTFGKVLLGLANFFLPWQCLAMLIAGYISTGFFCYTYAAIAASGPRGFIFNPAGHSPVALVIYILFWSAIWFFQIVRF